MGMITGLQSSLSGMKAAQAQIGVISNNIANVDTEGYTRKIAVQQSVVSCGRGNGVSIKSIIRNVDSGLLRSYLASNSATGQLKTASTYLGKTEILLGTPENDNSLAANVADLQSSFETLAADVTSPTNKYLLVAGAQNLANRLNTVSTEIQKLRGDADMEISEVCDKINTALNKIASLNNDIVKYTALNYDGLADLEDQRDIILKELSGYIDISYYKRDNGELVLQTKGGACLLDKDVHPISHSPIAQAATGISYAQGNVNGIYVDGEDITMSVKDGELKGLIDIRDTTLPSLQTQLDELAGVMKETLNTVHNQGTTFPAVQNEINGTRTFIDPNNQIVKIEQGDVRFSIFDADGKQVASTSLMADLGFDVHGESVTDLVEKMDAWLKNLLPNGSVKLDNQGKMSITTGDSSYYFSVMDTATSTMGSEQQNAQITLDNNGDGVADRSFSGFSNFFGLNDLFVSTRSEMTYTSNVMSLTSRFGVQNPIVLDFASPGISGSVDITASDTLQSIVDKINSNPDINDQIKATLVPNGNGYMLQISNVSGEQLEISERAQNGAVSGFISRIGLKPSNSNTAAHIQVREDITVNANLLSTCAPEFNSNTGEYQLNAGNNSVANKMAAAFSATYDFQQSGNLSKMSTTLANYASTFVGTIASQTNNANSEYAYQSELTNSIANKEATLSGVDTDEELSMMIIYQQSYGACAQVWSAAREMMDMLMNAL